MASVSPLLAGLLRQYGGHIVPQADLLPDVGAVVGEETDTVPVSRAWPYSSVPAVSRASSIR